MKATTGWYCSGSFRAYAITAEAGSQHFSSDVDLMAPRRTMSTLVRATCRYYSDLPDIDQA
jgi:hypothetical protein